MASGLTWTSTLPLSLLRLGAMNARLADMAQVTRFKLTFGADDKQAQDLFAAFDGRTIFPYGGENWFVYKWAAISAGLIEFSLEKV